ncbi:MAG: tRNA uridine(34) 5-carboxymethylaminomethyl modification radical SAM/GNAT enzyme Elp3 [Candidatus Heimdallarchaeota archaeon]|nr:MAG: tRNA uridine(34) 5-carboxymethylaminomethyl modification radical SAM/GNAT enzyme Elp3 [Candidatus Heimdallarchaeota archaeon]
MPPSSQDTLFKALDDLTQALITDSPPTRAKLETLKRKVAKRYQLKRFVKNSEILDYILNLEGLTEKKKENLTQLLQVRKVRTISGIAVVAVMTKPSPCPGKCIYCPEVDGAPKSYTGKEPAAMRGAQNDFIPKKQVQVRLNQLNSIGHPLDKVHLVIMGGTFLATPLEYQEYFVKECLDGITGKTSKDLRIAQQNAETSTYRNVGITFETRPDYCTDFHVNKILELGGTFVEIGIQTLSDDILQIIQRHHNLKEVEAAVRFSRDGGLKVTVHMMPNLFQTPNKDRKMFRNLYSDPRFIPDAVKIYPTLVLRDTRLYELWKNGSYVPYSSNEVVDVVASIKSITPPFVRIQRIQRDIPAYLILEGVCHGNLREIARKRLSELNQQCSCIRCREVGHQTNLGDLSWHEKDHEFNFLKYPASDGIEHFISFETSDRKTLFGFLRLREPSKFTFRPETLDPPATIIRELHVYGKLVRIGNLPKKIEWQHRGIGQRLVSLAEEISRERGYQKILVTSGLGVRNYYRKLGFVKNGVYMGKRI